MHEYDEGFPEDLCPYSWSTPSDDCVNRDEVYEPSHVEGVIFIVIYVAVCYVLGLLIARLI